MKKSKSTCTKSRCDAPPYLGGLCKEHAEEDRREEQLRRAAISLLEYGSIDGKLISNIEIKDEVKRKRLNLFVLDHFRDNLPSNFVEELGYLVSDQNFICKKIEQRISSDSFWYQPVALLAYWLVSAHPYTVLKDWPLASSLDALELIYSDLGKRNPNRN